jgi:hypothetical protein
MIFKDGGKIKINEEHYVSLKIARKLVEAGLFKYPDFIQDTYGEG